MICPLRNCQRGLPIVGGITGLEHHIRSSCASPLAFDVLAPGANTHPQFTPITHCQFCPSFQLTTPLGFLHHVREEHPLDFSEFVPYRLFTRLVCDHLMSMMNNTAPLTNVFICLCSSRKSYCLEVEKFVREDVPSNAVFVILYDAALDTNNKNNILDIVQGATKASRTDVELVMYPINQSLYADDYGFYLTTDLLSRCSMLRMTNKVSRNPAIKKHHAPGLLCLNSVSGSMNFAKLCETLFEGKYFRAYTL